MVNPQLISYIKSVRAMGYSDDAIVQHLINHGYLKEVIDEAFSSGELNTKAEAAQTAVPDIQPKKVKINIDKRLIIIPICILLIAALIFMVSMLMTALAPIVSCPDVSIDIQKMGENEVLCVFNDNSRAQAFIRNDGNQILDFVEIRIKGTKGTFKQRMDNIFLTKGNIFTLMVTYGQKYGDPKEITITPGTISDYEETLCTGNSIVRKDIKPC